MVYKKLGQLKASGGTRSIPGPPGKAGSKKVKGRTRKSGGAITSTPVKRTKPTANIRTQRGKMAASKATKRTK